MLRSRYVLGLAAAAVVVLATRDVQSQAVIRSGIDLVNVTVTVTDKDGRFIRGLTQDDFVVRDDGQPQEILSFSAERVPVSLGIVLDVSGSMTDLQMSTARRAIRRFAYDLLDPEDELFLAEFAATTRMLQTWTTDRGTLDRALDRARDRRRGSQWGSVVYDAVRATLPFAGTGVHTKKALLIISDGHDRGSDTSVKRLKEIIRSMDTMVYALAVGARGTRIEAGKLREFTDETGGRTEVIHGFEGLEEATARLGDELSQQYVLGYSSPHAKDGRWHTIKVEVRGHKDARVRARTGYVAVS